MMKMSKISDEGTDRLSKLPTDVRQHIVYLLSLQSTRDAIATSFLSKTWRYDWINLPYLPLGLRFWCRGAMYDKNLRKTNPHTIKEKTLRFLEFLGRALRWRKLAHIDTSMKQKLDIYLPPLAEINQELASCLDHLVNQEVFIDINPYYVERIYHRSYEDKYDMPCCVFTTQAITNLSLAHCNLTIRAFKVNLPSLRKLRLHEVHIDELIFDNIMAGCPAIEDLGISSSSGLKLFNFSGLPMLKKLMLQHNSDLNRVEINAPNLDYFYYHGKSDRCDAYELVWVSVSALTHLELRYFIISSDAWARSNIQHNSHLKTLVINSCNVLEYIEILTSTTLETMRIGDCRVHDRFQLHSCDKLEVLELWNCDVTSEWLNLHLLELVNLKVLDIDLCDQLENIKIFHNHIHTLRLKQCGKLDEVEIDCPNLRNFTYRPSKKIISLSPELITLTHTGIQLYHDLPSRKDNTWFVNLHQLFVKLRHSKSLTIRTDFCEAMMIPLELRQSYCPPRSEVEHFELFMNGNTSQPLTEIVDALLWLVPRPKTVRLLHHDTPINMFIKFTYKEPTELRASNCSCYSSDLPLIRCWKHSIKDFKIEAKEGFWYVESLRKFIESAITREEYFSASEDK